MGDVNQQGVLAHKGEERHPAAVHPVREALLPGPYPDKSPRQKTENPRQQGEIVGADHISDAQRVQKGVLDQRAGKLPLEQARQPEIAAVLRGDVVGEDEQDHAGENTRPGGDFVQQRAQQGEKQDGRRQKMEDTEPDRFSRQDIRHIGQPHHQRDGCRQQGQQAAPFPVAVGQAAGHAADEDEDSREEGGHRHKKQEQ